MEAGERITKEGPIKLGCGGYRMEGGRVTKEGAREGCEGFMDATKEGGVGSVER